MLVYMDLCCFNRPFDAQSNDRIVLETEAKLRIQERVVAGTIALAWSYMLDYENAANPDTEVMASIAAWKKKASVVCLVERPLLLDAARSLCSMGLDAKDALHVACAADIQYDYFITTDQGILKKRDIIGLVKIANPVEFILFEGETS